MNKRAEEAAYNYAKENGMLGYDYNQIYDAVKNGYEQAEKEIFGLAQLWVDSGDANVMSFQKFLKCYETQGNK